MRESCWLRCPIRQHWLALGELQSGYRRQAGQELRHQLDVREWTHISSGWNETFGTEALSGYFPDVPSSEVFLICRTSENIATFLFSNSMFLELRETNGQPGECEAETSHRSSNCKKTQASMGFEKYPRLRFANRHFQQNLGISEWLTSRPKRQRGSEKARRERFAFVFR